MDKQRMPLSEGAGKIIDRLTSAGYSAHAVGGSVRDYLIGRTVSDYDITTSATPDEVLSLFSDCHVVPTGIKHGTLTIVLPDGNYEVTTYRSDGEYLDGRHPERVSFSRTLADDLSRRDFTVNAICYNHTDGFTDLFCGIDDIKERVIRAVGEPERRFAEDALRILRAVRFSSQLGFTVEPHTAQAVHEGRELLKNVSRERCYVELYKLFDGDFAYRTVIEFSDIIEVFTGVSEVRLPSEELFYSDGALVRMLAYFALNTEAAHKAFHSFAVSMKTDGKTRDDGALALAILDECSDLTPSECAKMLFLHGEWALSLAIRTAVMLGRLPAEALTFVDEAKEKFPCSLSALDIDGKELMALGIRGQSLGRVLKGLLISVIDGECPNSRDALKKRALELREEPNK